MRSLVEVHSQVMGSVGEKIKQRLESLKVTQEQVANNQ